MVYVFVQSFMVLRIVIVKVIIITIIIQCIAWLDIVVIETTVVYYTLVQHNYKLRHVYYIHCLRLVAIDNEHVMLPWQ